MKTTPLYLGIDFGTTNSSVAYIYGDPRHLSARYVPVEPVRITMDAENNLTAERMPTLISTRFDDRRAKGLARGWEVLRIFGRRKKAPLLRRGHELFESVKSDLGSSRIYAHASSPECDTPKKVGGGRIPGAAGRGVGKASRPGNRQSGRSSPSRLRSTRRRARRPGTQRSKRA